VTFKLNSPKGLGDAIYVRAIVLHLLARSADVQVFTPWPAVFDGLPVTIARADAYTDADDLHHAMACLHCRVPWIMELSHFQLVCLQARLGEPVDLRMDWQRRKDALVDRIRNDAAGRPILLYQPQKHSKNPEQKLLRPRRAAFNAMINDRSDCFRVKIGHPSFADEGADLACELDLFGKTSIHDVFDIALASDMIFAEAACFLPIVAQAMDKPFTCMFARRGMASINKRTAGIQPRMFHKKHLATTVYDE
jgi:hypothetical protein